MSVRCQWKGEIGCFSNYIASNFFLYSYDARISFKNLLPVLCFLLIVVLFSMLLLKCYLIWITFCAKLCLRTSRSAISSFFSCIFQSGDIKTNPGPTPSSGQCFSVCQWNLNSIAVLNLQRYV